MTLLQIPLLLSCLFASPSFHAQSFETPHVKNWEASSVEQITNVHEHNGDSRCSQPAQNVLDSYDGLMIIESARYLDNIPPTHQIIYDFGETTFKLSDNATPQTKNLLIVKNGDDVKVVSGVGAANSFFKTVDDFALTFDKTGSVSPAIRQQAFDLYNSRDWNALENLFNQHNLNNGWPPAFGGYNIIDNFELKAGMKFDRYGGATPGWNGQGVPPLGGNFTSPIPQSGPYSFGQRALNQAETGYDFYYEIEILKDLPFKGQTADVIPWFGQPGGGKQTLWDIPKNPETGFSFTFNELADLGFLKVTIKASPSGNYPNLINTVIIK